MQTSVDLIFKGGAKAVALKTVISKKLLAATTPLIDKLRSLGQNKALQDALFANPNATRLITMAQGVNNDWANAKRRAIQSAEPEADAEWVDEQLKRALGEELLEEFPEVWQALAKPETTIAIGDENQVSAAIELLKVIIDDTQLSTEEKKQLAKADFWDEQDLVGVANAVASFRDVLQR